MVDSIYKTVQGLINKEQLGYLPPIKFNLFVANGQIKIWNKLLVDLKARVRRMNWFLDGKDFANFSENVRQLIEHFSDESTVAIANDKFPLPSTSELVMDVFTGTKRIDKIHYSDFLDLQTNIYANPTACNPVCSKVGDSLKVLPTSIDSIDIHFLRIPKTPKWTFEEVNGKPLFDPTKSDYQDVDMPKSLSEDLIDSVVQQATFYLRDLQANQVVNQEQAQEEQIENKQ